MQPLPISITMLVKNSVKHLVPVLNALQDFDEIVVLDTGSTDNTMDIVRQYSNTKLYTSPFTGFGELCNLVSTYATHDWILLIDSDEVVSPELIQTLRTLTLDPHAAYSFPRRNFYRGRWIKGCGWYPDRVIRLYHRAHTQFSSDLVHQRLLTDNVKEVPLNAPLLHYPFSGVSDFLNKMQHYSTLFATQRAGKRRASVTTAIIHGFYAFFKSYFLQRGFLDGYPGFLISTYNGNTAFYKYLKLYESGGLP